MSHHKKNPAKQSQKNVLKKENKLKKNANKNRGEGTAKTKKTRITRRCKTCMKWKRDTKKKLKEEGKSRKEIKEIVNKDKIKKPDSSKRVSKETKNYVASFGGKMSAYQMLQLKKQAVSGGSGTGSGIPDEWLNIDSTTPSPSSRDEDVIKENPTKTAQEDYNNNWA